jgi:hypothetical protein
MRRACVVLALVGLAAPARAIRPFITDDARVVGARTLQLENWVVASGHAFEHWAVPAFGPTDYIELTVGACARRRVRAGAAPSIR